MTLLSRYYPGYYSEEQFQLEKRIVKHAIFLSVSFTVFLWFIKLFELEFGINLSYWGLLPGDWTGLRGILFSPLIHANIEHLAANSLPLLILLFTLFFFYRKSSYTIFFLIYVLSGCFVWLGGREALHIGASGLIYGLAGFLFLSGILGNNIRLLTISLMVALFYGGLFWGIFPVKPEISWESHLWGGVSGFLLAIFFRKSAPIVFREEEEDDNGVLEPGEWEQTDEELPEQSKEEEQI